MIIRLLLTLSLIEFYVTWAETPLRLVDNDHSGIRKPTRLHIHRRDVIFQRRRAAAAEFNARRHFDRHSRHIIFAPLDGKPIITKENMYINGNSIGDDGIYEDVESGRRDVDDIDSFFVTPPPQRTTVAVKLPSDNSIVDSETQRELHLVSGGSPGPTTTPAPLRLVTLPAPSTTPPPPFKHIKKHPQNDTSIAFGSSLSPVPAQSSLVRFPAQPWQIPPRDNSYATPPNLFNMFELNPRPDGTPPVNPFSPNGMNLTYPFLPIGVSNPSYLPQLPGFPPNNQYRVPLLGREMVHKSPLRVGYAKNTEMSAIPLPTTDFDGANPLFPTLWPGPTSQPDFALSIDEKSTQTKPARNTAPTANAKLFRSATATTSSGSSGRNSAPLRNFAKQHPNIVSAMKKPTLKGHQMVQAKSNFGRPSRLGSEYRAEHGRSEVLNRASSGLPPPISPAPSGLNPNQKLDLCCRKQKVSNVCQSMCNFDTFNDKTLVSAFLTNQCPGPQLGKAYDCASSKADHSSCCERNGLATFLGGRCMPFCRTHMDTPPNVLEYVPCLQVFETIKSCYREYQLSNKNIFGD